MPMDVPLTNAEIPRLPVLTQTQKQAIHHTVCEVVAATVLNRPVANLDPELNGISSENVMGVVGRYASPIHYSEYCAKLLPLRRRKMCACQRYLPLN